MGRPAALALIMRLDRWPRLPARGIRRPTGVWVGLGSFGDSVEIGETRFGVDFLNPYVPTACVATVSIGFTSLSIVPVKSYGFQVVTSGANSKRPKRLRCHESLS